MSIGQFLDHSGDNEPQNDGSGEPPPSPKPPRKPQWWESYLDIVLILGLVVFVLWLFSR